jgi:hypothetical protein
MSGLLYLFYNKPLIFYLPPQMDIFMAKKTIDTPDRDDLAELIASSLNKLHKGDGQVAFFLDGREETPTDVTDFISTGATMLDVAISNRKYGGIGVGRITELSGLEGCVTEDTLVDIEIT